MRNTEMMHGLDALEEEAWHWEFDGEEYASIATELLRRWVREAREEVRPTCRNVGEPEWPFRCSRCGGYTTEFDHMFAPPEVQEAAKDAFLRAIGIDPEANDVVMRNAHSSVPRFCPWCGAEVVGDE